MVTDAPQFTKITAPDFDLALTLDSGQTFHWEPLGAGFVGTIGDEAVHVKQRADQLFVRPKKASRLCAHYFALDHPLAEICAALPNDPAARDS